MKTRFISSQVLLNKDGSMKAQRVYAIPEPSVVSFYLKAYNFQNEIVKIGVIVQDWNTSDCLEDHPDMASLARVCDKSFGLKGIMLVVDNAKKA